MRKLFAALLAGATIGSAKANLHRGLRGEAESFAASETRVGRADDSAADSAGAADTARALRGLAATEAPTLVTYEPSLAPSPTAEPTSEPTYAATVAPTYEPTEPPDAETIERNGEHRRNWGGRKHTGNWGGRSHNKGR